MKGDDLSREELEGDEHRLASHDGGGVEGEAAAEGVGLGDREGRRLDRVGHTTPLNLSDR